MSDTTHAAAGEAPEIELNPDAGIEGALAGFGAAGSASAESAEILNLLGDQESGGACCGGSCCSV
ncbi:hypothetical protein ACFPZL_01490 [Leucobacter soli]|uniref:Uncharacterized protein n=1 Tax=Leucobacter soli TaxID=2812850 RepID=A0A916K0Z8_9MICO|nr:hypothetical protein [Leucobacter soli]CAG7612722.1 hypothetical protein LEUCIP111803_01603 [Leucobacter soli]